jgi:hypothetical protein
MVHMMQVSFIMLSRHNFYFWDFDYVFCIVLDIKLEPVTCDSEWLAQYVYAAVL